MVPIGKKNNPEKERSSRSLVWTRISRALSVLLLLISLAMGIFVIDWKDSCSVIADMWKASTTVDWLQEALIKYSDILVAVLASIIIALLSISITMYVFSKSALDRIIDENPYITSIVRLYQEDTLGKLLWTTLSSMFPLALAIGWYSILRFQPIVYEKEYHSFIIGLATFGCSIVVAVCFTASFWIKCLGMRNSLFQLIQKGKKDYPDQIKKIVSGEDRDYFLIGYWTEWETEAVDKLIAEGGGKYLDSSSGESNPKAEQEIVSAGKKLCENMKADQYINLFSRIEVLLMSGVGGTGTAVKQEYSESDIITVIQERSDILRPTIQVEKKDLDGKKYRGDMSKSRKILDNINRFRIQIGLNPESDDNFDFFQKTKSLYITLKEYRDLLISERYVSGNQPEDGKTVEDQGNLDDTMGLGMYYFFLRVLGLFVSAVDIKDYTFNGNVLNFADFYNSTLTNVSFYSAQFYHTVFARTRLVNVSMDLSEIDNVFFYYTKLFSSSMSNTNFTSIDFENVQMQDCDMSICVFTNCGINNSRLVNTVFNGSSFENSQLSSSDFGRSKLWDIKFHATSITDCDFTGAEIQGWRWADRSEKICLRNCSFDSSIWDQMSVENADLSGATFDDASLIGVVFKNVDLSESLFRHSQLAQAKFHGCKKLEQSSFQDANLFGAIFTSCLLNRSSFFRANASYAKIENCSIQNSDCAEAYFRNSALTKVVFNNARLYNSTFDWAYIKKCQFTGVLAEHIQFTSAKCIDTRFDYATLSDSCFSGTTLEHCYLFGTDLSSSEATKLTMLHCEFDQADFSQTRFVDCIFAGAGTPVKNSVFYGARFAGINGGTISDLSFDNCDFSQSVFSNIEFDNVTFQNCVVEGTVFSSCQFKNVVFNCCRTGERDESVFLTKKLFIEKHLLSPTKMILEPESIQFIPVTQRIQRKKYRSKSSRHP